MAADDQNAEQPQRLRPARRSEVVLARGTRATGELKSEGDIRVDGVFEGRIEGVGWVIVGPEAQITGDIVARHVLVDGWVHGNVQAVGQVQVRPTGQVWGDVMAAQVLVDPGAEMHPAGEEPPPPRAAPARPPVEIRQPDEPSVSLSPAGRDWLRQPWAVAAGVIAAGILVVCGVLVLSGVFAGPGELGTPTQVAQRETATSTTAPTVRPTQTATARPTVTSTRPPSATPTAAATATRTPRPSATPTRPPTATPTRPPTATSTRAPTATPTTGSAATATPAPTRSPTEPPAPTNTPAPTEAPTSTVAPYPFAPDGGVTTEYPNCAPAVVWLRGQVRDATPEQLEFVTIEARYPDGRVMTEPVQPNGSYEIRLYSQGPCPVALLDSRDGTQLSFTVNVEYGDTCNGSAFTLYWKRVAP